MKRFSVVFLLLVLILTGCRSAGHQSSSPETLTYRYTKTPQEAVDAWVVAVNKGEYQQAARYMHSALEIWERDPLLVKSTIEGITWGREIVSYERHPSSIEKKETATLAYRFEFANGGARSVTFELVKRPAGWIIIHV